MPNTRCPTRVATRCSISSGERWSSKQPANRATNPIARSVAPSSIAPASEVILPPSKAATTARPSTGTNPNKSALHSVRIGLPLPPRQTVLATRFSQIQGPDAPTPFEKSGLAGMLRVLLQANDHLAPALHIQLAEQVVDMQLRCRQADVQPTGDFLVTEPRRDQLGGLPFAPGERECRRWRVAADAEALGDGDPVEQLGGHPARTGLLATVYIHDE